MITVERNALVGHSAARLYALVEDVESYPAFLPWCAAAEVRARDGPQVVVTLRIRFHGVRQQFTTRNTLVAGERIEMALVEGPFRRLDGVWRFVPLGADACRVELRIDYELGSPLLARAVGPTFDQIANTLVDAFVRRADALHGAA
ncbi:MAG: type II toxin-antitoxin system RatA family toxin [Gammaproteobacteria bacterium]|nr:type II toxin-antitoxin system RatA family toxin [Gammaproteobacteria bacterium]